MSPNAFSLVLARFLIDSCGSTARQVTAGSQAFWVVDPPKGSTCPSWQAVPVYPTRFSLLIGKYLLDNCRYTVRRQAGVVYVVPVDHPVGRIA